MAPIHPWKPKDVTELLGEADTTHINSYQGMSKCRCTPKATLLGLEAATDYVKVYSEKDMKRIRAHLAQFKQQKNDVEVRSHLTLSMTILEQNLDFAKELRDVYSSWQDRQAESLFSRGKRHCEGNFLQSHDFRDIMRRYDYSVDVFSNFIHRYYLENEKWLRSARKRPALSEPLLGVEDVQVA